MASARNLKAVDLRGWIRHQRIMRSPSRLILFLLCLFSAVTVNAAERPNILFFLVDDMGWADIAVNGSTFHETPHIDRLAATGMNFTHGYAACPVCSPTRASILTGRHPVRVDITDWIPGMSTKPGSKFLHVNDRDNLAHAERTLAEELKDQGYKTFFAGKWHLGKEGHWPEDQGFDINIGGHDRGSPPGGYYAPWRNPALKAKRDGEYLTERLTHESAAFIDRQTKDAPKQPFLLYLSYYNIHTPIQPYKKRIEHYEAKRATMGPSPEPIREGSNGLSTARQDNAALASMVAAVDDSVGALLGMLEKNGIADNTIVVFTSDNGGLCTKSKPGPGCNLPLRSGKGWLYEGGVREPTIIRAPGVTRPGSRCEVPVVSTDFFPTLLELAKVPLPDPSEIALDGLSLVPLLQGKDAAGPLAERALYWHYPHYHGSTWKPGAAIRDGDWKLIEFYETDTTELYNLAKDPGERNNLAEKRANKTAALRAKLAAWQKEMGAKMPVLRSE